MFEAIVTLCLLGDPAASTVCREVLVPGFAADSEDACRQALERTPPDWLRSWAAGWMPSCAPRPASRLAFAEIAPGVFVHHGAIAEPDPENAGDVANIAFVIGNSGVAVIDAGGSRQIGEQVYLAVRDRTDLPITDLILTHMHPDHVFGAEPLREAGARVLGHASLPRALSDRTETYTTNFARLIGGAGFLGSRIIGPDAEIAEAGTVDLGARVLALTPWPAAHTETDLSVFDPVSSVLFAGDLLFDTQTPALDGSLRGWRAVLTGLEEVPALTVVPGHGGPTLAWPGGAEAEARYLGVLESDTRAALDAGLHLGEAAEVVGQSEAGNWQLFDLFNPRNATVAFTELEWE